MISFVPATALHDGDSIGIFSPSEWLGNGRPEHVRAGCDFLKRQGFGVRFATNYLARDVIPPAHQKIV